MASQVPGIVLASLTLGVAVWIAVRAPAASPGADTSALEQRLAAAERRADAVAALRDEVRSIRELLDRRPDADAARAGRADAGAAPADGASPGATGPGNAELVEAVAERVGRTIDEKIDRRARRAGQTTDDGRWKAPLDDLATELALSEAQKSEAKRVFDAAKDQGFALLRTQRIDGGCLLDDYAAALRSGADPAEATQEFFRRIVNERVPGSDETYLSAFIAIGVDTDERLARGLDPAQRTKMRDLRLDLLGVETGYDPTGDYVRARVQ